MEEWFHKYKCHQLKDSVSNFMQMIFKLFYYGINHTSSGESKDAWPLFTSSGCLPISCALFLITITKEQPRQEMSLKKQPVSLACVTSGGGCRATQEDTSSRALLPSGHRRVGAESPDRTPDHQPSNWGGTTRRGRCPSVPGTCPRRRGSGVHGSPCAALDTETRFHMATEKLCGPLQSIAHA